jgi:hypothetical protein
MVRLRALSAFEFQLGVRSEQWKPRAPSLRSLAAASVEALIDATQIASTNKGLGPLAIGTNIRVSDMPVY